MSTNLILSLDSLNNKMLSDFLSVVPEKNPVIVFSKNASVYQRLHILVQYSWFSRKISAFFLEAFLNLSFHKWKAVSSELAHNIQEELSQDDHQRQEKHDPHYVLLRKGFIEAFNTDISFLPSSSSTSIFIKSILELMTSHPARTSGAAYALESSAVPELTMMYEFTKETFKMADKPLPNSIKHFFDSHINELEIGHEERLKEVCEESLKSEEDFHEFSKGFIEVISIMDRWWISLSEEMKNIK